MVLRDLLRVYRVFRWVDLIYAGLDGLDGIRRGI